MNLYDSSALLAYLRGEQGDDRVRELLMSGDGRCSAANWSEVAQKLVQNGRDWAAARALLLSYDLAVEAVTAADAELAAELWSRDAGLSLGDRLCLATGRRLRATVWTTDTAWGESEDVRQVR